MALSLVAGPTDIVPLDPLETYGIKAEGHGLWLDGRGILLDCFRAGTSIRQGLYLVQPDGKAIRTGYGAGSLYATSFGYSPADARLCLAVSSAWWKTSAPVFPRSTSEYRSVGCSSFGVLPDRVIGGSANAIYAYTIVPAEDSVDSEREFLFAWTGFAISFLAYAGMESGHHRWWCLDETHGWLALYDSTAKAEVAGHRSSIGAFHVASYSVEHDVFVAVRTSGDTSQLSVYANEPVASAMSAPSFSPSVKRGVRSTLSARVTGDLAEPCPGRNVTFAVTAGTVDPVTVATDANGYARTAYDAPTGSAPSGATATATLEE